MNGKRFLLLILLLFVAGCNYNPSAKTTNAAKISYVVVTRVVTHEVTRQAECLIPATGGTGTPQGIAMLENITPTLSSEQDPTPTYSLPTQTNIPTAAFSATPYRTPYPTRPLWTYTSTPNIIKPHKPTATKAPPTQVPPTQEPPTQIPPTQKPPTKEPPTQEPPTQAPPTQAPTRPCDNTPVPKPTCTCY